MQIKSILKSVFLLGILFLFYFAAGKFGLSLAFVHPSATAIWPPTGIALAAFLLFGNRVWPAIFLGAFFVNLTTVGTIFTSLAMAAGNTLEGVLASYLINKLNGSRQVFGKPGGIFIFLLAVLAGALVSATIGVSTITLGGFSSTLNFLSVWTTWLLGDMGGAFTIAPLIIIWYLHPKVEFKWQKWVEALCLIIFSFGLYQFLFGHYSPSFRNYNLTSFILPALIWAAYRFGQRGAASIMLFFAIGATYGTLHGRGRFVLDSPNESLLLLQIFIIINSVVMLMAAATKDKLSEDNARDEAILEGIGDGMMAMDKFERIIKVNHQAKVLLGREGNGIIGQRLNDVVQVKNERGENIPASQRPSDIALATGKKVSSGDYYYARKNGSRFPVHLTASPVILNGEVIGVIKIFRDITREKDIDKAKTEFISLASHQLRTPITIIKWYVGFLLEKNRKFTAEERDYMKEIEGGVIRMSDLVDSLLNISRIEMGSFSVEPTETKLAAVADVILKELAVQIKKKNLTIKKKYHSDFPAVMTDPKLMRIILQNLIINSIKYTLSGGWVEVDLKLEQDNFLSMRVADNGVGIPEEERAKIFTKFFRTDSARELDSTGTGLGLYIVKSIVDSIGGKIWFESAVGKGTTFFVNIPLDKIKKQAGAGGLIVN